MADEKQAPKEKGDDKKMVNDKSWAENMIEKISKDGSLHASFIKAMLSVAGCLAGLVIGYFLFGKNKEKEISDLNLKLSQLGFTSKQQENEIGRLKAQLDEQKKLNAKREYALPQNDMQTLRELPKPPQKIFRTEYTYLD